VKGTPRPTRLGWLPLIAAPVLGVLSVMTVDSWLLLLAGASLGLGIAAILLRPKLGDLDLAVHLPTRAEQGEPVDTLLQVTNTGRRVSPLTTLTHQCAGLTDVTVVVDALAPGGSAAVHARRTATGRGRARTSVATLTSSAPLGLVTTAASGEVPTDLTIHPALVPVPLLPQWSGGAQSRQAQQDRAGVDVHGIREWRSGDEARQVHWRSTARRGRLVVLEREAPRGGALTVLVAGPAATPGWEQLVSVVASHGVAALRAGAAASLFTQQAGHGPLVDASRLGLLDWCAALNPPLLPDAAGVEPAVRAAGRGGRLYVATTGAPASWWAAARSMADAAGVELAQLPVAVR
jgi:uncharacterized protein (DUF58 family)